MILSRTTSCLIMSDTVDNTISNPFTNSISAPLKQITSHFISTAKNPNPRHHNFWNYCSNFLIITSPKPLLRFPVYLPQSLEE